MEAFGKWRQGDSAFLAKAAKQSFGNCMSIFPKLLSPFYNALCLTAHGKAVIAASISCVLYWQYPSNITQLIVALIIFSVHLMFRRRSITKFGIKFWKILESKFNTAATVIIITLAVTVLAPGLSIAICSIFRCMASAVNRIACRSVILLQMAARTRPPIAQMFPAHRYDYSTFTKAEPHCSTIFHRMEPYNGKQPKGLTGYIKKTWIAWKGFWIDNGKIRSGHTISLSVSVIRLWIRERFPRPLFILT